MIKLKHELTQIETDRLEEEFLTILSDLIDDPTWLDMALNQNNSYQVGDQLTNRSKNGLSLTNFQHLADPQGAANRVVRHVNDAEITETDLEDTIIVPADVVTDISSRVSSDLSLQAYPYQKSIQKD